MNTTRCRGCGTPLENPDAPCPTCGFRKIPDFRKKVLQFAALFAILGLIWLLFLTKSLWLG